MMVERNIFICSILTTLVFVVSVESKAQCEECLNGKNNCSGIFPCGNFPLCYTNGAFYCIKPIIDFCAIPDVTTACLPNCNSGWVPLYETTCDKGVCCVKLP